MKQLMIGIGVLGVFILYSLGIRHEQPTVVKPTSLTATIPTTTTGATNSTQPTTTTTPTTPTATGSAYKDGTYTGSTEDAYYGNVQVAATISGGKLTDVQFLDYPHTHSDSVVINQQAMPYLKQEAIQAQSSNVQIVSGATFTSQAFIQSLDTALGQAKA